MHRTKLFRLGNSQAVQIPADLAYPDTDTPFEIERIGDELRIRPARKRLTGLLDVFAAFPDDFLAEGRGDQSQGDRGPL